MILPRVFCVVVLSVSGLLSGLVRVCVCVIPIFCFLRFPRFVLVVLLGRRARRRRGRAEGLFLILAGSWWPITGRPRFSGIPAIPADTHFPGVSADSPRGFRRRAGPLLRFFGVGGGYPPADVICGVLRPSARSAATCPVQVGPDPGQGGGERAAPPPPGLRPAPPRGTPGLDPRSVSRNWPRGPGEALR